MRNGTALAALACVTMAGGCQHANSNVASVRPVEAYIDAYNARDLDRMKTMMHDDVQWLSVEGSQIQIFAQGKADLVSQMEDYFSSPQRTRSVAEMSIPDGNFVAVRERAYWTTADGQERSQSSLAVYELEDGLIRRVWYYPATR